MSDTEVVSVTRLIDLVRDRPVLWDRQEEVYKNRKLTRQAWTEICEALVDNYHGLDEQDRAAFGRSIIGKWANLRDNWLRYWRKRQELLRVGSSTKTLKKYIHHDQLLFLSKVYDPGGQQEVEEIQVEVDVISDTEFESAVEFDETSQISWSNIQPQCSVVPPDQSERHLYFFHSILPMICDFDDDQVLEFHAGVLEWVKRVKHRALEWQDSHFINHRQESNNDAGVSCKLKSEASNQSDCFCNSARQPFVMKSRDSPHTLSSSLESKSSFQPEIKGFSSSTVKQTVICDKSEFVSLKDTINNLEKVTKRLDSRFSDVQDYSGHFGSLLSQLSPKKIQSLKRKIVKEVVKEGLKKIKEESPRCFKTETECSLSNDELSNVDTTELNPSKEKVSRSILRKSLEK